MIAIDDKVMLEIAPHLTGQKAQQQSKIVQAVGAVLQETLGAYEINTRLRIAHFLGQTCEESDGFCTTVEYASGDEYEGRTALGNIKRGDGRRYKGRGLLQLTGRANYVDYGKALNVSLEDHPELAAEPVLSLRIACEYWKRHNINAACDRDDLVAVTKKVNGGTRGLSERSLYTRRAKEALARIEAIQAAAVEPDDHPVLRRGSTGEAVGKVQTMLSKLKFPLAIDQDYGAATELAVMRFQADKKLPADGLVGGKTWDALESATKSAGGT